MDGMTDRTFASADEVWIAVVTAVLVALARIASVPTFALAVLALADLVAWRDLIIPAVAVRV